MEFAIIKNIFLEFFIFRVTHTKSKNQGKRPNINMLEERVIFNIPYIDLHQLTTLLFINDILQTIVNLITGLITPLFHSNIVNNRKNYRHYHRKQY